MAVDGSGNVVVAGTFGSGTVDFGGGPLTSAGNEDIFVAKYSSTGAHLWSKRFGGADPDHGHGVAFDGNGNVVVVGDFDGHDTGVDFGGGPLGVGVSGQCVFLAKYGPTGTHLWSKGFGAGGSVFGGEGSGHGVAVDGSDNVVVTGEFLGTVDFGGGPLTSTPGTPLGSPAVFIAKYSPTGAHLWSKGNFALPLSVGHGYDVAANGSGNVAVVGDFEGTVDFGGGPLTSAGGQDIFVASYGP